MNSRDSLARGAPPARPGTLHARSLLGSVRARPEPGCVLRFGRTGPPEVELAVGDNDLRVSRRHGELTYRDGAWWLRNHGQQLVRLPRGQLMHASTDPMPIGVGYTPLFVKGSGHREHLVELYVTDYGEPATPRQRATTLPPKRWTLQDDERLVLVVLGQRYLLYEPEPRPLSYRQAAAELTYLSGGVRWGVSKVAHKVEDVRMRLSRSGDFPHELRRDEPDGPSDNTLKHNLLKGLVESTTLVPPDLALLEQEPSD
ncbi:FHA domain-containing protein [Streptomyces zagrosensis]|uniref:FHA domain-containing protein n=1 Tax=Streptomyces zagrosensis TaxID=1042984 RepID=A0A7W9QCP4_9ACTN|nr:FHA domain-containing protein [Streptomyces zagrosensis]MBB5936577.1 hypothetical protein [Streptomyces zagrosensis]